MLFLIISCDQKKENKVFNNEIQNIEKDTIIENNETKLEYNPNPIIDDYFVKDDYNCQIIKDDCLVFVYPTTEQIEIMKQRDGDDFYTVADDMNYYFSQQMELADNLDIKHISNNKRKFKFITNNDKYYIVDIDKKDKGKLSEWTVIAFNPLKKPELVFFVEADKKYLKEYFISENNNVESIKQKDTVPFIELDYFPVTENIFRKSTAIQKNNPEFVINSGEEFWYTDKNNYKILIFEVGTDYHRITQALFDKRKIPEKIFNHLSIHIKTDTLPNKTSQYRLLNEKESSLLFKRIKPENNIIDDKYFSTKKGFKLGAKKNKAIEIYGKPDSIVNNKNIEILYWNFIGFEFAVNNKKDSIIDNRVIIETEWVIKEINDENSNYYQKPLLNGGYKPGIIMFFNDNELIGIELTDIVP